MRRFALLLLLASSCAAGESPDIDAGVTADAAATHDAGSSDAGPSDAGAALRGTCDPTDDACHCVPVPNVAAGWHTCRELRTQADSCTGSPSDECCNAAECQGAGCFYGPLFYCGGARPEERNVCVDHECAADDDCGATALCIPAGAFGEYHNRCAQGDCRFDADCGARAGGACLPFFDPCNRRLSGFHCAYPDSACRADGDCGHIEFGYCEPLGGGDTECRQFIPRP